MLRVKYERRRRGWSQVDLAFHTRMSVGDISRIENGRLRPYPSQLEKLATVLEISPDDLLEHVATPVDERRHREAQPTPDAAV